MFNKLKDLIYFSIFSFSRTLVSLAYESKNNRIETGVFALKYGTKQMFLDCSKCEKILGIDIGYNNLLRIT